MNPEVILLAACLPLIGLLAVRWWWQVRARKQFLATIKRMAVSGRDEIGGQPVEYWLDILNQHTHQPLAAGAAMLLIFEGQEFFFIDGAIAYITPRPCAGRCEMSCRSQKAFFLIAVGRSSVRILSDKERVFRHITGSTELAAFSIYRWSDFAEELKWGNSLAE